MDATPNHMQPASTIQAKLTFKSGKWKDDFTGIEKDVFISKLDGKIVYAGIELNLRTGVSYDCEMSLSSKGRAWNVSKAEKTPVIKTNLEFKYRKKRNDKTSEWREDMVGTYPPKIGKIVIANMSLNIEPNKLYSCEIVLSPQGKAYIVERAEIAMSENKITIN